MKQQNRWSKYGKSIIKGIGKILSVIAIIFIVKKIIEMDFDYTLIFSPKGISIIIGLTVVQTILIFLACRAWEHYLMEFGAVRLNRIHVWNIYAKANLFKYIPGNVFQYIGRNELAAENPISHKNVAAATVADTLTMIVIKVSVSVVMLQAQFYQAVREYIRKEWIIGIAVLGVLAICILLLPTRFQKNYTAFICRAKNTIAKSLCDYLCIDIVSGIMYIIVICFVLNYGCTFQDIFLLIGGYTLGSVIGFLTPGVPGGIGIREAVIIFLSQKVIDLDILTAATVIMRIICVAADILAFIFVYSLKHRRKIAGEKRNYEAVDEKG